MRRYVHRLARDLKTGDRAEEYAALLRKAVDAGYHAVRLQDFEAKIAAGSLTGAERLLVLRHDVDVANVDGNRMFFELESTVGARSTFFFRLSTAPAHHRLIQQLLDQGFEVGYHFEEVATLAMELRLRRREDVLARRDAISERFIATCARIRESWGPGLASASSHGHWLNRRFGITNHEMIDRRTLDAAGIVYEAYEQRIMDSAAIYISDVALPPFSWANGASLGDALKAGISPLYVLTHEARWHSRPRANIRNLLDRMGEAITYSLPNIGPTRGPISGRRARSG